MTAYRLDLLGLGCARGDRPLFVGLNERVSAGEVLHVAGSNGSGKTTLLRTLCGLSRPADGEIRWRGVPIDRLGDHYRADLAYLGHKDGVQGELSAWENLSLLRCADHGTAPETAPAQALERLGMAGHRSFPAKLLSQGQRRRVALARLLVQPKPLWILDEPFTALDAVTCRLIAEIIAEHVSGGGIAVLSSHQAFDIGSAATRRIDLDAAGAGAWPTSEARAARSATAANV